MQRQEDEDEDEYASEKVSHLQLCWLAGRLCSVVCLSSLKRKSQPILGLCVFGQAGAENKLAVYPWTNDEYTTLFCAPTFIDSRESGWL